MRYTKWSWYFSLCQPLGRSFAESLCPEAIKHVSVQLYQINSDSRYDDDDDDDDDDDAIIFLQYWAAIYSLLLAIVYSINGNIAIFW